MRDYRERYQKIKEKGKELNISISQFINRERFLYFHNNYYANFSTIPLKDYLSIVSSDTDIGGERLYPILSYAIEKITPLKEDNEFKDIGYRIISKLEEEQESKGNTPPIFYLPIELSLLFNTHNEDTIEETLARYLITFFKPIHTTKEQLIGYLKEDFNKYALLFNAHFSGGYLSSDKPLEFEDLISRFINKKNTQKTSLIADNTTQKDQIRNIINGNDLFSFSGKAQPFNSDPDNNPLFSEDAIKGISQYLDNTPLETPPFSDISKYGTEENSNNINYIYLTISFLITFENTIREIETEIKEINDILLSNILLTTYKSVYDTLFKSNKAPKVSTATIIKEKNEDNTPLPIYYPTGEPSLDIIFKAIQQYKPVSRQEELDYITSYRLDIAKRDFLKAEIEDLKRKLANEQQENGYSTQQAKSLDLLLREKIDTLKKLVEKLEKIGTKDYAPNGYFLLGDKYYKGFSKEVDTYQVSPTDSVVIISENTNLRASNHTLSQYNDTTNMILAFIMCKAINTNNYIFRVSNEEIERLILKDRYNNASLKDRDNARNISFIGALTLLSRTTLETSYTPSETAKRKGIKPRKRGGGSLLWFTNYSNYVEVTIHSEIYSIAIKDFPIIPTSNEIYKLKPRAFITAIYLYNQCAFNHTNLLKRSFESIIEHNPSYTLNLKYIDKNPKRLYAPILEDFNEMRDKGIVVFYTPTLKEYEEESLRLRERDLITFRLNIKPQKERK